MNQTVRLKSAGEVQAWAEQFQQLIQRPCLILLQGEMGVGKTQLVRWMLTAQGVLDVASPTYAIHHQYQGKHGVVDHFDLYRVESVTDLESTGFWDVLDDPLGLVIVEWPDRLSRDIWPKNRAVIWISLSRVDKDLEARTLQVLTG